MMGKKRKSSGFSDEPDYDGDSGYLEYDLRLVRRWKRRCIANKDTKLNSVDNYSQASKEAISVNLDIDDDDNENFVDADYRKYLDSLSETLTGDDSVPMIRTVDSGGDENMLMETANKVNSLESNSIEMGGGNRGDIMDASYPSYCINRKPDVNGVDGFAKKGNSGEELVGNKFMDTDACDDVNNFNEKKRNSDCVDHVAAETVADSIENEDSGCVDVDSQTQSADNHTCQNDELNNIDPEYDFFLKNMRTDWNESPSNVSEDSGHIDVDTSQNDDLDDPDDVLSPKDGEEDENVAFCNFSDGGSGNNDTSQNDDLDNNDPDYEFFLKNVRQDGTSFVLEIPECNGISQILKYEVGDGCRVENPDTSRSSQEGSLECDVLDESYDMFMKALTNEGGLVAYMPENGPKVVYDEDDEEESLSDSDVVVLETNPVSQSYEIILSDDEEIESDKAVSKSDCWFREKVVELLKKPFDQAEYDSLLHDASVHKPVTEDRDMRYGRSRTRIVNTFGKSYLEVHKDLGRKVNAARSKPKVLNLLRGFFYWLQNTPHGVFKPWEDNSCLQVLPSAVASRPVLKLKKENIH